MAKKWPEQRWRRKWSEIIDSLIRILIEPGHGRDHRQDRPAQEADKQRLQQQPRY